MKYAAYVRAKDGCAKTILKSHGVEEMVAAEGQAHHVNAMMQSHRGTMTWILMSEVVGQMSDFTYENFRRVSYGEENATFVPVCEKCGQFVKADSSIKLHGMDGYWKGGPNATCKKCGRVEMPFEGFFP